MKYYNIFYATSTHYDFVVVSAESLDDAFEMSKAFSRVHAVTILGVCVQCSYIKLYPYE